MLTAIGPSPSEPARAGGTTDTTWVITRVTGSLWEEPWAPTLKRRGLRLVGNWLMIGWLVIDYWLSIDWLLVDCWLVILGWSLVDYWLLVVTGLKTGRQLIVSWQLLRNWMVTGDWLGTTGSWAADCRLITDWLLVDGWLLADDCLLSGWYTGWPLVYKRLVIDSMCGRCYLQQMMGYTLVTSKWKIHRS